MERFETLEGFLTPSLVSESLKPERFKNTLESKGYVVKGFSCQVTEVQNVCKQDDQVKHAWKEGQEGTLMNDPYFVALLNSSSSSFREHLPWGLSKWTDRVLISKMVVTVQR